MKYTTKDIIKQACNIADMENTKLFSHNDFTNLLNQAWKQACQSLINKGCHYFYKSIIIGGGYKVIVSLPDDFFQLGSITCNNIQIPRKNGSNDGFCYDIIQDYIEIIGATDNIKLEYYTTPVFLTYKDFDKKWEKPSDFKSIETAAGDNILYRNKDLDLVLYNTKTKKSVTTTGFAIDEIISTPNILYVKSTFGGENTKRCLLDWQLNVIKELEDDENIIVSSQNIFIYKRNENTINIYANNNMLIDSFDLLYTPTGVIYTSGNVIIGWVNNKLVDLDSGKEYSAVFIKPVKDGILLDTKLLTSNGLEDTDVRCFNIYGVNEDGYITDDVIIDYTPDTLLDFPNTLFFEYLSNIVAYLMILKTNGNTDSVTTSLSIAEYTFYDSLDNSSTYKVIRNVY